MANDDPSDWGRFCLKCGYPLYRLRPGADSCPECGQAFDLQDTSTFALDPGRWWRLGRFARRLGDRLRRIALVILGLAMWISTPAVMALAPGSESYGGCVWGLGLPPWLLLCIWMISQACPDEPLREWVFWVSVCTPVGALLAGTSVLLSLLGVHDKMTFSDGLVLMGLGLGAGTVVGLLRARWT